MTTDLKYLAWTAMLTAALWIPYVVCQVMTNGSWRRPTMSIPRRARCRFGASARTAPISTRSEVFAPFAVLVIVAHLTGKANAMTAFWAACFFWLRLAHAVVYLLAVPYVRTLIFTLGFVAIVGVFWEVIT